MSPWQKGLCTNVLNDYLHHTELKGSCLEWTKAKDSEGYPRCTYNGNVNTRVQVAKSLNTSYKNIQRIKVGARYSYIKES